LSEEEELVLECYNQNEEKGLKLGRKAISERIGLGPSQIGRILRKLRREGLIEDRKPGSHTSAPYKKEPEFTHPLLPEDLPPLDELLDKRKREFARRDAYEASRHLAKVKVKIEGPVGIVHMGDPHVDDPGSDIAAIERDLALINSTEGLFGANVGDAQNNWVGRLAHLYADQGTTQNEAWALVEWMVTSVDWLYLVSGNHDVFSGGRDPLKWIVKQTKSLHQEWGVRLELKFPNGKAVRVNARHDFRGHSQWNPAHGPMKAIQMGWRDHILSCGHKHISAHSALKDPSTGLISHAIRVAGYKIWDKYAKANDLPNQNISPAVVTIIDPQYEDDDPKLITTIYDTEMGADFLTFLRKK
jgi:DNA-binding transcriptional ArsR family regulator